MNKIILTLLTIFGLCGYGSAQNARHVLGLRLGSGDGFGTEVSYQHGLSADNRLEIDLGLSNHHENHPDGTYTYANWGLTGLYHWVHKIDSNFNWYIGPGAQIGAWNYDHGYDYEYNNGFFLVAAGDVGIEYIFPVGIQLALNARPEIGLVNHGTTFNVGIAVRYQFK